MPKNQTMNLEPLSVSIMEATRLLGFKDPKSVRNLIRSGDLHACKAGRILFPGPQPHKEFVGR